MGRAALSGFKAVVSAASDAQQSLGATETVFGKYADTVVRDSDRAAKAYGLSANTYRENANLIGSLFKNQGVATGQLAGKTKEMIGTASDLAATFGGTTTQAVEALGSAFKGEFDPLEKYGISIKQSTVNTEAMRVAHVKSASAFGKLSAKQQQQIKSQALSNLVMKQSKDSAGAFAKESDTLAHQQQVLGAQFDNVKVAVGRRLLPVITKFLSYLTENGPKAISAFKDMAKPVIAFFDKFKGGSGQASGNLSKFLATVKSVWASVQSTIQSAVTIIQALWKVFGSTILANIQSTFTNLLTIVRGAFQVIKGIFDVFAGILTGDWSRVWSGIKSIFTGVANILKGAVKQLWNTIATVFRAGGATIKALFGGAWNALKGIASAAWNAVKSATSSGISNVVSKVKELPGKVKSGLGSLKGKLVSVGEDLIRGFITGIGNMAKAAVNKVGDVVSGAKNKAKSLLGIHSPSRVFRGFGENTIQGLINGIGNKESALKGQMKKVTALVSGGYNPSMNASGALLVGANGGGGTTTVNIKVDVPLGADPVTVGRETVKAVNAYFNATGKKSL